MNYVNLDVRVYQTGSAHNIGTGSRNHCCVEKQ